MTVIVNIVIRNVSYDYVVNDFTNKFSNLKFENIKTSTFLEK